MKFINFLLENKHDKILSIEQFDKIKGYLNIETMMTELENYFKDNDMTSLDIEPYMVFTHFSKEVDTKCSGYFIVRRLHHDDHNRISYHINQFDFIVNKDIGKIGKIVKKFEDQNDSADLKDAVKYLKTLSPYILTFTDN